MQHYGEGLKAVINEKFGDGIMSGRWVAAVGCAVGCCCPATPAVPDATAALQPRTPSPPVLPGAAIDFYCTVDKITGKQGEARVVITFNGKVRGS